MRPLLSLFLGLIVAPALVFGALVALYLYFGVEDYSYVEPPPNVNEWARVVTVSPPRIVPRPADPPLLTATVENHSADSLDLEFVLYDSRPKPIGTRRAASRLAPHGRTQISTSVHPAVDRPRDVRTAVATHITSFNIYDSALPDLPADHPVP